jgi:hypothetical protein
VQIEEYLSAFDITYKEEPARVAYGRLCAKASNERDDPDLEEAWLRTLPLIRIVFRYEFPTRSGKEPEFFLEDLESSAASALFEDLWRRKVPSAKDRYTNWCFKVIKFRFLDTVREHRRGMIPRGHKADTTVWIQPGLINVERMVELADFSVSIPQLTKKFVLQRIGDRFFGSLYSRAAEYTVNELGYKSRPNLRILENYYGIPKPEFWVDLIAVLLREALYVVRRKYGKFLYGSSAEYIYDYVEGLRPTDFTPEYDSEFLNTGE